MTTTINASNSGSGGLIQTADASGVLALQTAGVTAVTIDTSQNVGIGTSSPGFKLVTAQASGNLITSMQGAVKTWNLRNQADGTFGFFDESAGYWRYMYDVSNNHIWFNGASAERMRIDSSGNVGIGTTTPNFQVSFGANIGKTLAVFENAGTSVYGIGMGGAGTGGDPYRTKLFSNGAENASITDAGVFSFNSGYGSVGKAYGCRAWVNFNGSGTVAIRASGNVSSITDNAAGSWTVNFTTAMPDVNYSTQVTASAINIANNNTMAFIIEAIAPTTSAVTVGACNDAGTARDSIYVCVAVFR